MAVKKFVQKTLNGEVVPGEFVLEDATYVDVLNPLVPVQGDGPAVVRTVAWALFQRIVS